MIGIFNTNNGTAAPNGLLWQCNSAGLTALRTCLSQGGTSGALTRDAINPTDNFGGGGLARQTIALTINVAFNIFPPAKAFRVDFHPVGAFLDRQFKLQSTGF